MSPSELLSRFFAGIVLAILFFLSEMYMIQRQNSSVRGLKEFKSFIRGEKQKVYASLAIMVPILVYNLVRGGSPWASLAVMVSILGIWGAILLLQPKKSKEGKWDR